VWAQPVIRTRTTHVTEALVRTARRGRAVLYGWQRAAAASARRRQTQAVERLETAAAALETAKAAALQQVTVPSTAVRVSERRQYKIHRRLDIFGLPVVEQEPCMLCVRETAAILPAVCSAVRSQFARHSTLRSRCLSLVAVRGRQVRAAMDDAQRRTETMQCQLQHVGAFAVAREQVCVETPNTNPSPPPGCDALRISALSQPCFHAVCTLNDTEQTSGCVSAP
jgi:hypothetical protein